MTTVAEIRAGKTCPGCDIDCRNFVEEADSCIYNTFISELYTKTIEDESNKEVHYEPVKKKTIIVKIDKGDLNIAQTYTPIIDNDGNPVKILNIGIVV